MTISSRKEYSIALVAFGGSGWMGGALYSAHIFESLLAWRRRHSEYTIKLWIVCSNVAQLLEDFPVYSNADGFICSKPQPLLFRVFEKFLDFFAGRLPHAFIPNSQVLAFIRHKIDYVYPYIRPTSPLIGPCGAAWIPDFQHKFLPQYFSDSQIYSRNAQFRETADHASDIVFSSHDSLLSFRRFFPRSSANLHVLSFCSIPPSNIWSEDPEVVRLAYDLPRRFFLCSGQFWAHKNQKLVLDALAVLLDECRDLFVVFTGHTYDYRAPQTFDHFLEASHRLRLRSRIAILGMIPRVDQLQLMRLSIAAIQPSLFEGWSTVVEDARACGKRIILSDLPVHAEQQYHSCVFFERSSAYSLASAMRSEWVGGEPGPDLEEEQNARRETSARVLSTGEVFMSIALSRLK